MTDRPPDAPFDVRWRWALRALVVVPIVVAVARALNDGWFPVGDNALLTVRAADVGSAHTPLLGSWTSASLAFGTDVNNPGPLYYDLVAPFMWTFGRVFSYGAGSAIGVGTLNALSALGTVLVANRIGGWRFERWVLLLVAALTWSMGSELLFDIWQPHALLLPFTLLVVLTVGIADGDVRLAPGWLAVLSVIVQTHIGYAYVGVALLAVAATATVMAIRARHVSVRDALASRTARWSYAVVALAWSQPLGEQLFGAGTGNLERLATNAGGGETTVGAGLAVRLLAAIAVVPPGWTRFGFADAVGPIALEQTSDGSRLVATGLPGTAVSLVGVVALLAVLVALLVALREPAQRLARRMVLVSLVLLVVALGSVAIQVVTVTGLGSHQVRWLFAMAAIVHVSIVWAAVELATPHLTTGARHRSLRSVGDGVVIAVVAALTLANLGSLAHALGPSRDPAIAATLRAVFDDLSTFEPPEPVAYDLDHITLYEPYSSPVLMRLAELGIEFRLDQESHLRHWGTSRRADGTEQVWLRQYERDAALLYDGPGCVLSRHSGVGADAELSADALIEAAAADLASGTVSVEVDGLPAEMRPTVEAAVAGDLGSAVQVVARGMLPLLIGEGRLVPTPAIAAAGDDAARDAIAARVDTTLAIVVTPASDCPGY